MDAALAEYPNNEECAELVRGICKCFGRRCCKMKLFVRALVVLVTMSILYIAMDYLNTPPIDVIQTYYDQYDIRHIINEPNTCKNHDESDAEVEMFVCVLSAANKSEARQTIRDTWGKTIKEPGKPFRLVFFVANAGDAVNEVVKQESDEFHDIVQFDHEDTYNNLTLKSISLLRWIHSHCQQTTFILKADDDMVINVKNMVTSLRKAHKRTNRFFLCNVKWKSPVIRDIKNKWYVTREEYRANHYPPYCQSLYAFTGKMILEMVLAASKVPLFKWEDIHVTSNIANEIQVSRFHHNGIRPFRNRPININKPCLFKYYLATGGLNTAEIRTLWRNFHERCTRN
ncbi:beta-1,3-galactosyltransferase 1-like [Lineus longissimus]|uniref:beta-1,3-galactosyltransferase 1-like n=1 Tax=Lineus longissimus TaxID=88925 RepID=UPI002B4E9A40